MTLCGAVGAILVIALGRHEACPYMVRGGALILWNEGFASVGEILHYTAFRSE